MNKSAQAVLAAAVGLAAPAQAAEVVGGTDILTMAHAVQIERWLAADSSLDYDDGLVFTNVFDKSRGDTSLDFHAAVDELGPTFFVVEAIDSRLPRETQLIGGFNPASWRSDNAWTLSTGPTANDRIAFIFNLVLNEMRHQSLSVYGQFQTYNGASLGPMFGVTPDLRINADLTTGTARSGSYCVDVSADCTAGRNIMGLPFIGADTITFGAFEVFAISAAVPVPPAAPLLLGALGLTGWMARGRKSGRPRP